MCVFTFLEAHDWAGKTVIPFTTHEGSGFGQSLRDLKAAIPSATVKNGLSIQGSKVGAAGKQIEKFVAGGK
jgi:flavodoxin